MLLMLPDDDCRNRLGFSLDDLNHNEEWERGDELDLSGFEGDEVYSRRPFQDMEQHDGDDDGDDDDDWENAFEDDLAVPGSLAQPGRAQSASSQGFIPHGGSTLSPLTLPKRLDEGRSENSNMVFNQQTLCWEGGEVDLGGFDTDSDGYTGHEDNWDKDFDDDGALIQERLHTNGTGFSDLLSKVFRRNLAGGRQSRQELTMENVNRHKAKHPQRPILITPEDVNMTLIRSNSRASAFSDEFSALEIGRAHV